jgi:hypothetical protein
MNKEKVTIIEEMKELLSDTKNRIKLEDFVIKHLRTYLEATNIDNFPINLQRIEKEEFLDRMNRYEVAVKDLQKIVCLIARWSGGEQLETLGKVFNRISELNEDLSTSNRLVKLRFYPILILMYTAGIAALSAKKYEALKIVLTTKVQESYRDNYIPIIKLITSNFISEFHDFFKWIPGKEDKHVPLSENLFEILNPTIEEILFIGNNYEKLFDDYEMYSALVYINTTGRDWGPIGRFGWKYRRGYEGDNPFKRIVKEAENEKENWIPLKVGLFDSSFNSYLGSAKVLKQRLDNLQWF